MLVMNSKLQKKLLGYSSLAGTIFMINQSANGQIIYSDISDINLSTGDSAYLDLNNDNAWDVHFQVYGNSGTAFIKANLPAPISSGLKNMIKGLPCCTCGFYVYSASAIDYGEMIENGFVTSEAYLCADWSCIDQWSGKNDKYMGLLFYDSLQNPNYGWVRISVGAQCNFMVIKDVAYSVALPLFAGQTGLGTDIQNSFEQPLEIFTSNNFLYVKNNFALNTLHLSIFNELGQLCLQTQIEEATDIISLNNLGTGIYLIQANDEGHLYKRKILIE
jgi:hypothetical protein